MHNYFKSLPDPRHPSSTTKKAVTFSRYMKLGQHSVPVFSPSLCIGSE
uniref:Uncharacterized protein n=1 Tax=Rhizophora mucronata TaxID=61149 RepID=A0A2P2PEK7_RHIMU